MLRTVSDIDLRLLRVFVAVATCGGFAAAQSTLNVSQANISMRMKQLEERIGMRLCHRGRGGFWLTDEGKDVYDACQKLFRSIDEFCSAVASSSGRSRGRLHISVIDNSIMNDEFHLHAAIGAFKEASDNSEVILYVVAPNDVEQMVLDGSCDLGIGFFPAHRQGMEYAPLFTSDMDLFCGRESPLFEKAPDELHIDEVFDSEHAARGYVSVAQLPRFERKFLVGASSSTVEGLMTLVLSGKYTAYLPRHYATALAGRRPHTAHPAGPDRIFVALRIDDPKGQPARQAAESLHGRSRFASSAGAGLRLPDRNGDSGVTMVGRRLSGHGTAAGTTRGGPA